jgi:invasion protein IalB
LTRFLNQTLAAIALATLSLAGPAAAQSQDTVKATHGDWDIRCSESEPPVCVMSQVGKTADGKNALELRIRKLEGAKTKDGTVIPAAIQITTPLGSILRAGVRMQIDATEPRTGQFEVCVPSGCVVRDAMSEEFLKQLKSGNAATLTFGLLQQGEVVATISLKGFTKAFKAL